MEYSKQNVRIVLYPILYWVIFIIIPFVAAYNMKEYHKWFNLPGGIMFYILFIAPFLFFIPYKLSKIDSRKKFIFIFAGLVVPYIVLYIYVATQVLSIFNKSRFPF